jgi:hypothetical protein
MDFSQFSASSGDQVMLALDAATAFDRIVAAIQSAGGQIQWQTPPHKATFLLNYKDVWNTGGLTVKYSGELTVSPTGPSSSMVQLNTKVNWSSMVPVLVATVVGAFVFVLFIPMFGSFLLLIILLGLAYYGWMFGSKVPNDCAQKFLAGLPKATGPMPGFSAPGGLHPSPGPAPQPGGAGPPSPPPEAGSASVAERIKQLASLRELGAITEEEYKAKKAELLKQL